MNDEGFIADLHILRSNGGIEVQQLARREKEVISELYRLVPELSELVVSELKVRIDCRDNEWWLHLALLPRHQGILIDLTKNSKRASLRQEVQLVRQSISKTPLRVRLASDGLMAWAVGDRTSRLDPVHELVYRRSRQQWLIENETGQLCLPFADVPRYLVDEAPCRIRGRVEFVSTRTVGLSQVEVTTTETSEPQVLQDGRLKVIRGNPKSIDVTSSPETMAALLPGHDVNMVATIHRCLLTRRPVGAIASTALKREDVQ
jgi:hypothetical protein